MQSNHIFLQNYTESKIFPDFSQTFNEFKLFHAKWEPSWMCLERSFWRFWHPLNNNTGCLVYLPSFEWFLFCCLHYIRVSWLSLLCPNSAKYFSSPLFTFYYHILNKFDKFIAFIYLWKCPYDPYFVIISGK